jgi:beta-ureidopropionase
MKTLTSLIAFLAFTCVAETNHLVRVVTLTQNNLKAAPGEQLLKLTIYRLNAAAKAFRPDIACLPETFSRGEPESVPGPTTKRLADWARTHKCWVICPLTTRVDDKIYNSAVLLNRTGSIVGRYDKIRPTENELKKAVCPGPDQAPVFETEFGKVGIQICFDVNWTEQWRSLRDRGAKIIFFPSAYPATRQLRSIAWQNQCFIVSATKNREAAIYDITGDQIDQSGHYQPWAQAILPVGKRLFETDFNVHKMRAIERDHGQRVRVQWFHDDALITLESLDPQLSVNRLIKEYELTPHSDYLRRSERAQEQSRKAP